MIPGPVRFGDFLFFGGGYMKNLSNMTQVQKLTMSGMVMALYIVILYFTQSFSFGAYQIRIATALYALAYLFPFLVVPLGLSNFISNMAFGGFGIVDMLGGCIVGIVTTSCIMLIRKYGWNCALIALPIIFVPGLGVATYLSHFTHMLYPLLALNLCIGQVIPSIAGVILVGVLQRVLFPNGKEVLS